MHTSDKSVKVITNTWHWRHDKHTFLYKLVRMCKMEVDYCKFSYQCIQNLEEFIFRESISCNTPTNHQQYTFIFVYKYLYFYKMNEIHALAQQNYRRSRNMIIAKLSDSTVFQMILFGYAKNFIIEHRIFQY